MKGISDRSLELTARRSRPSGRIVAMSLLYATTSVPEVKLGWKRYGRVAESAMAVLCAT